MVNETGGSDDLPIVPPSAITPMQLAGHRDRYNAALVAHTVDGHRVPRLQAALHLFDLTGTWWQHGTTVIHTQRVTRPTARLITAILIFLSATATVCFATGSALVATGLQGVAPLAVGAVTVAILVTPVAAVVAVPIVDAWSASKFRHDLDVYATNLARPNRQNRNTRGEGLALIEAINRQVAEAGLVIGGTAGSVKVRDEIHLVSGRTLDQPLPDDHTCTDSCERAHMRTVCTPTLWAGQRAIVAGSD